MRVSVTGLSPERAAKTLVVFAYAFLLLIILGVGDPSHL